MDRNEKVVVTKKQVESVYNEIERRLYMGWADGVFESDIEKMMHCVQCYRGIWRSDGGLR